MGDRAWWHVHLSVASLTLEAFNLSTLSVEESRGREVSNRKHPGETVITSEVSST